MAVGEDKVRVLITIPKEMKATLEELAEKEVRTVSNFIVAILKDYLDKDNQK